MPKYIVLRDQRLVGGVPNRGNMGIINTDGATPLGHTFKAIRGMTASAKAEVMFILCHGFAGANMLRWMSIDAGGYGLMIGTENMKHRNVAMWEAIRGCVACIVVYACAAANTEPGNEGTASDGEYLMGALAIHTGADVYAADRIQWYDTYRGLARGRMEFGRWEGRVLRFDPSGRPATRGIPPRGLADVMGSLAP